MSPANELQYSNCEENDSDVEMDGHVHTSSPDQPTPLDNIRECRSLSDTSKLKSFKSQGQTTNGYIVTSPSEDTYSGTTLLDTAVQTTSSVNGSVMVMTKESKTDIENQAVIPFYFIDLSNELHDIENNINIPIPQKRSRSNLNHSRRHILNRAHTLPKQNHEMRKSNHNSPVETKILIEMVKIIFALSAEKELLFCQDCDGDTKLHLVIIFGLQDVTMELIDSVTDYSFLDMQNRMFQTPLILAVLLDMPKVARRLMSCGAEIDICDHNGNTPLHIACRDGNIKIAELLLTPITREEVSKNKYEIPYRKIPQDLGIRNFEGETCIEIAFKNKDIQLIDLLLDKGANVDQRCLKTGRTLLYRACLNGYIDIVKRLIGKKCDINLRAYDGSTPFDAARASGHWQIAVILAERGAESDSESDYDEGR